MTSIDSDAYEIESGVPLPEPRGRPGRKYPLAEMGVGESFALASSDIKELERVRAAVSYYGIRHPPTKFAVRMIDPVTKQYRCWRIA